MPEPDSIIRGLGLIEAYDEVGAATDQQIVGAVLNAIAPYLEHDGHPDEDELWILLLDVLRTTHTLLLENFTSNDVLPQDLFALVREAADARLRLRVDADATIVPRWG